MTLRIVYPGCVPQAIPSSTPLHATICPQEWGYAEIGAMGARSKAALSPEQAELLRQIPSVDELLAQARLAALATRVDRNLLVEVTRTVLAELRARITGQVTSAALSQLAVLAGDTASLEEHISALVERILAHSLQRVINATGVILHTNLGRAPLPAAVVEEFRNTATQYSNLEYDLETGSRGKRDVHTSSLLERLTGAEAAIVVNNCAAAVLLVLSALAKGGEAIVSRGELIEIGDGFRIPEIMAESGAILREVGTTNRTRLADYESAIQEQTRLLLRVHPSNFRITGFADKPSLEELVELSRRSGLPLVEDLGSGCLFDLSANGMSEPLVRHSIEAGVSLVMFSGDKLLGGPQAGIIAGKKDLVTRVRRHPLFRALRVDKLTTAALEVTLGAYLRAAWEEIPALRMIRLGIPELQRRSENFLRELRPELPLDEVELEISDGSSLAGGGSTPAQALPTKVVRIASARYSAAQLEERLRRAPAGISVIARVENDRLILDLRTVFPEQEPLLVRTLAAVLH
ncbi:MAG TPA: L-seryl-tRNA(Sec) selenium transferase [Candidatus Acidoferrum sp.]|nr:L-seryl-tRNA(Sec) selenium transferase [Candidatus Acidoferrum sp.]